MKRAYWIQLLVLVFAMSVLTATSVWAKTKKAASKTDADVAKKKTTAEETKVEKAKDKAKDKDDEPLFPKKDKADAEAKDEVEIHPDLAEVYAEIAEVVKLDEEGQKKFLILQEKKTQTLEKFDAKYSKMIVKIENELDRTNNKKRQEKLLLELTKISSNREKLQQKFDNQALRALRADQIIVWNTYELWAVISPEFDDELEMTDEQVEKSKAICDQIAKMKGPKARIAQNPMIKRMAISQIGKKVLTKQQKKAYTLQQRRKRLHEEGEGKTIKVETRRGHHR